MVELDEQILRDKPEASYVPSDLREGKLTYPTPRETLTKPPIETLTDRKPPPWHEAHQVVLAYTREQIRLGLAPEGIERVWGPGPWDHDPSFWRSPHDNNDETFDWEIAED